MLSFVQRVLLAFTSMKYWEIVADKLSAAGWSWGYCSAVTRDGWRWIVDARRNGRRYVVESEELLSAFLELEATLRERRRSRRSDRLKPFATTSFIQTRNMPVTDEA